MIILNEWIKSLSTSENAQNYFHFLLSFKNGLARAITKFGNNVIIKSDSWRTCETKYLVTKLIKNYNEYFSSKNIEALIDIINYSLMLLERQLNEVEVI